MVQENFIKGKIIVICGPTGSGKTALAIKLANLFNTEIISADSIAIYRGLDIGTAKPTAEEKSMAKHNLIDIVDPKENFSVSDYENFALKEINRLFSQGKCVIICGGTGYYIDAVLFEKSYGNCPKNDEIRAKYEEILNEFGAEYLFSLLEKVDEETAKILHPNDTMRVIRALEIFEQTGIKKSQIKDDIKPRFDYFAFSYDYDRQVLYDRINLRVDKMFENGLLEEVKGLLSNGVEKTAQSMQGIGYKEVVEGIENDYSIEQIKDAVKQNSRRYAKRQITYFKKLPNLNFIKPSENEINEVLAIIENGR